MTPTLTFGKEKRNKKSKGRSTLWNTRLFRDSKGRFCVDLDTGGHQPQLVLIFPEVFRLRSCRTVSVRKVRRMNFREPTRGSGNYDRRIQSFPPRVPDSESLSLNGLFECVKSSGVEYPGKQEKD